MTVSSRAVVFVCLVFAAACGSVQSDLCADVTCGANATCGTDTGLCACNDGFSGDGMTCTDVDECTTGNPCDANATCANTPGGFDCTCDAGYDGDGVTCADVDECAAGTSTCDPNASCTNNTGSYDCACNDGYYGDGTTCFEAVGQAVLIGHDLFERNADVDKILGNSVLLANTLDSIEVVGYDQYADLASDGEPANSDAAIQDVVTAAGRTVNITRNSDYTTLPAALTGKHVLVIYEQENGLDYATVGTALDLTLHTFIQNGGIVIGMDYLGTTSQLMNTTNVIHNVGVMSSFPTVTLQVTTPADPIVAGLGATYTGSNGTSGYATNDGVPVVVDDTGNPVVIHKTFGQPPRFDGTFGTAWEPLATNAAGQGNVSMMSYQPAQFPDIYNMYNPQGQRYTVATDTWTALPNAMPYSDYWFQLSPIGLALYGFANTGLTYRFSTLTNAWTPGPAITGTAEYSMSAVDEAGNIYGYASNGNVIVYNPAGGLSYRATSIPALRGSGSLYETRIAYDPAVNSLFLGGYGSAELYRFDLGTGVTTQVASIPESQLNDIFCSDRSGHIYAAGDFQGTTMFQYTISSNTWSPIPAFPIDHGNTGTCTVSADGYLYVSPGDTSLYRLPLN